MASSVQPALSGSAAKARLLQEAAQEVGRLEDSLRRNSRRDVAFRKGAAFWLMALSLAFVLGYSAALLVAPASLLDIAKVRFHETHKR